MSNFHDARPAVIAIVTRTKDRSLLLDRSVRSVLAQTYDNWCHVVVNDGGDAAAVNEVLAHHAKAYADRLVVIHHDRSRGMEAASNSGIRNSNSRYIVLLDDDDTWHPEFLRRATGLLQAPYFPGPRGVCCHTDLIEEEVHGNVIAERSRRSYNNWMQAVDMLQMLELNRIPNLSFLYEREALLDVGLYDEALPVCGDWEFNLRFLMKHEIIVLPETLAYWHQRPHGLGTAQNSITHQRDLHNLYRTLITNRWIRQPESASQALLATLFAASRTHDVAFQTRSMVAQLLPRR